MGVAELFLAEGKIPAAAVLLLKALSLLQKLLSQTKKSMETMLGDQQKVREEYHHLALLYGKGLQQYQSIRDQVDENQPQLSPEFMLYHWALQKGREGSAREFLGDTKTALQYYDTARVLLEQLVQDSVDEADRNLFQRTANGFAERLGSLK